MADIEIGGTLHSVVPGNVVARADEILDATKEKKQSAINAEVDEALTEQAGLIAAETARAEAVEAALQGMYERINANDIIIGPLPSSGQEERKIYRVPSPVSIVTLGVSASHPSNRLDSDGELVSSGAAYHVYSYDVSARVGETIFITGYNPGSTTYVLAAFYNSNGEKISVIKSGDSATAVYKHPVEVPSDAVSLKVSGSTSYAIASVDAYSGEMGASYTDWMWYNNEWVKMATFTISNESLLVGLYTCQTAGGTAPKAVTAPGFQLPNNGGGAIKIKMSHANTSSSTVKLNIGDTGAKTLFYNGQPVSASNTWADDEIVDVYYDPTYNDGAGAYYASSIAKIADASVKNGLKQVTGLTLNPGYYKTGETLDKVQGHNTPEEDYYSLLVEATPGTQFIITGFGGTARFLWATYNEDGERSNSSGADADTRTNPVTITLADTDRYLVVNTRVAYVSESSVQLVNIAARLRQLEEATAATITEIEGDITDLGDAVEGLESDMQEFGEAINQVTDAESDIEWTLGKFLKTDGTLANTSKSNKVGKIKVKGYSSVAFNCFVLAGGGNEHYTYAVTDESGTVLEPYHSEAFNPGRTITPYDVELDLPDTAFYLLVSWTSEDDYEVEHYLRCYEDIPSLYKRVEALENSSVGPSNESNELNVEPQDFSDYRKVSYNNADYSYTNYGNINFINNITIQPESFEIETPVVDGATSRVLEVANDYKFNSKYSIELDLESETYSITNLVPERTYYYRVAAVVSGSSSYVKSGKFVTKGQVRFLKIGSLQTTYNGAIKNVRDIGGWDVGGGKRLRYGVIIRGSELDDKNTTTGVETKFVSPAGVDELKNIIGVSAELDFRQSNEIPSGWERPLGVEFEIHELGQWFYRANVYNSQVGLSDNVAKYANAYRTLLSFLKEGKTVYIHCSGGCDRTGAFVAILEGICGVSENNINYDYEASYRNRDREYYSIYEYWDKPEGDPDYNRKTHDGDFKYAMEYIKGLKKLNDVTYTKVRCYKDSLITIDDVVYHRDNTVRDTEGDNTKYCKWTDGNNIYYTRDIYPTSSSVLYDTSFQEAQGVTIEETEYEFYYNAGATVTYFTPAKITDSTIISQLEEMPKPSLKEQFRMLMQLGTYGLTNQEMDELEMLLTA